MNAHKFYLKIIYFLNGCFSIINKEDKNAKVKEIKKLQVFFNFIYCSLFVLVSLIVYQKRYVFE
jgi:hypothetical protein